VPAPASAGPRPPLPAQEGATVRVADSNVTAAEAVASAIRGADGKAEHAGLNVADETAWTVVIERTSSAHRRLDVLLNNAGVSAAKPLAETTLGEWRRAPAVNLGRVFPGTRHALNARRGMGGGGWADGGCPP
jgi:3-hydroxybutyrate dehydrogenase